MPRKKTTSRVLKKSELRLDNIRSISSTLDVGNGLTVEAYAELIDDLQDLMSEYNTALAGIERIQGAIGFGDRTLNSQNTF